MSLLSVVEDRYLRSDIPEFRPGDTVRVYVRIREGEKERVQAFEGVCIRRHRAGARTTFTVRKISYGIGVERIFVMHSPMLREIEVLKRGRVRQSRLYYLRGRTGKKARIRSRDVY